MAGRAGECAGMEDAGKIGPKTECLAYIKEVWTDMRPLSLRKKIGRGSTETLGHLNTLHQKLV
jgi:MbtH protein